MPAFACLGMLTRTSRQITTHRTGRRTAARSCVRHPAPRFRRLYVRAGEQGTIRPPTTTALRAARLLLPLLLPSTTARLAAAYTTTAATSRMAATNGSSGGGDPAVRGAVIFLHGSGGNGRDLEWILRTAGFQDEMQSLGLELICPTAPPRPYTFAGGERMSVWFDREDLTPDAPEVGNGADESYRLLASLLDRLKAEKGIEAGRVFVGGFSMGGGQALQWLSRHPQPVAGVFGLGSFLATQSAVYDALAPGARAYPPVFLGHGQQDSAVHHAWGLTTAKRLYQALAPSASSSEQSPPPVAFYSFPHLDHEFDHRELAVLASWIRSGGKRFPDAAAFNGDATFRRRGGVKREPLAAGGEDLRAQAPPAAPARAAAAAAAAAAEIDVPMALEEAGVGEEGTARVTYTVPADRVGAFVGGRPVVARGAHFTFTKGQAPGAIVTEFFSPKPRETAEAIRERVKARLRDPDGGGGAAEGVCQQS